MKKILLINASNRKKNTYKLLVATEKLLQQKGFATEIIHLNDYRIDFCKGCEVCVLRGKCFVKDDVQQIMDKMRACDGLVIGTPVYLNNMTGILKSFIDRTCSWFHRTEMAQIPTLLVVNTQGSGIKNTIQSLNESLIQWGVCLTGSISRSGRNIDVAIEEKEVAAFVKCVHAGGRSYVPSFKEISTYNVQRALATKVFPVDEAYWKDQGWMAHPYFPQAQVNPFKKVYGKALYQLMCKVIKPHDQ